MEKSFFLKMKAGFFLQLFSLAGQQWSARKLDRVFLWGFFPSLSFGGTRD